MPQISPHRAATRGTHCRPLDPRLAIFAVRGDGRREYHVPRKPKTLNGLMN
jgi:hypothetical protein